MSKQSIRDKIRGDTTLKRALRGAVSAPEMRGSGETRSLLLDQVHPNPDNPRSSLLLRRERLASVIDTASRRAGVENPQDDIPAFLDAVEAVAAEMKAGSPTEAAQLEGIASLARSIQLHGQQQPILVGPMGSPVGRPHELGDFQLIAGERRWLASMLINAPGIRATYRSDLNSEEARQVHALVENLHREDLSFGEKALAFYSMVEIVKSRDPKAEVTAKGLQELTGESERVCYRYLQVVNGPKTILEQIRTGQLRTREEVEIALNNRKGQAPAKARPPRKRKGRVRAFVNVRVSEIGAAWIVIDAYVEKHPGGLGKALESWPRDDMDTAQRAMTLVFEAAATLTAGK